MAQILNTTLNKTIQQTQTKSLAIYDDNHFKIGITGIIVPQNVKAGRLRSM